MAHTEYHRQDDSYRIIIRGKQWFVQQSDGMPGSKTRDPWFNIGRPRATKAEAKAAMYGIKPEVRK